MKQNVIDKIEIEWLGKYAGYNLTMFHKEEMIFSLWFTNVTYNSEGMLHFFPISCCLQSIDNWFGFERIYTNGVVLAVE